MSRLKVQLPDGAAKDAVEAAASATTRDAIEQAAKKLATAASESRREAATQQNAARKNELIATAADLDEVAATLLDALSVASLTVKAATLPVAVRLTNPPSTRLRVSFDNKTSGKHIEIEWDPAVSMPLIQHITLDNVGHQEWAVSVTVDPVFIQQGDGSLVIATRFSPLTEVGDNAVLVGRPTALVASGRVSLNGEARQVSMTGWPAPTISLSCGDSAQLGMDALAFAQNLTSRPGQQRSAAVAPEIVTQTLSILAEIAVQRAKSGAMAVVKERFVDPLCVDKDSSVTLAKLHLGSSNALAFPRTCELLQSLRLEDILSSGESLLRALRDDARFTIAPEVITRVAAKKPLVKRLLHTALDIVNRAIERGTFDGLEAQLVVHSLGNVDLLAELLPILEVRVSNEIIANLQTLAKDKQILDAICGKETNVTQCLAQLLETNHTPADWIVWSRALPASLGPTAKKQIFDALGGTTQEIVSRLVGDVETALADATIRSAFCPGAADAKTCLHAVFADPPTAAEFVQRVFANPQLRDRVETKLREVIFAEPKLHETAAAACRVRLAVAVIKKCAGASCSASQVSAYLDHPEDYFNRDTKLPASLCWDGTKYLKAPAEVADLQRLVIDGLELVEPLRDTEGRDRAVAAIELVFKVLEQLSQHDEMITVFKELCVAVARQEFDVALGASVRLANVSLKGTNKSLPRSLRKLTELSGAVAAYAAVYKATKDDDPKAARETRKKSLESLIDAATDRKGRGRTWIVSLGSNVGGSITYRNVYDKDDGKLLMQPKRRELAARLPMGISIQYLPGRHETADRSPKQGFWPKVWSGTKTVLSPFGLHFGVNLVDLGYFVKADPAEDTRWSSFVAPGIEAGLLLGSEERALNVTFHASFAPGMSDPAAPDRPLWTYGVAVGYYVPFFDLN